MDLLNDEIIKTFFSKVDIPNNINDCWVWKGSKDCRGYGRWGRQQIKAHRLSFLIWNKKMPDNCCCHECDNPSCVNPLHLWDGTTQQNTADKVLKGRQVKGEKTRFVKLIEQQVLDIRLKYATTNITQKKLAIEYNVSQSTIKAIINKRCWKYLQ